MKPTNRIARGALAGLLLLVAVQPLPAAAQDSALWSEVGLTLLRSERVTWTAVTEFRTEQNFPRNTFPALYNTTLRFSVAKGWSLRGGYATFIRGNDRRRLGWQNTVNAGVTYPVFSSKVFGSTIYEHAWLPAGRGERDRLRQRFEMVWRAKERISPFAYEDLSLENGRGFYRSRSRLGMSFDLPRGFQLRTGYQFQTLQQRTGAWVPRHAMLLQLRLPTFFDLRQKKGAPIPNAPTPPAEEGPENTLEELDPQ